MNSDVSCSYKKNDYCFTEFSRRQYDIDKRVFICDNMLKSANLLNDIIKEVMKDNDIESISETIINILEDKLPADYASLWLCDTPSDHFTVIANGVRGKHIAEQLKIQKGTLLRMENASARGQAEGWVCFGKKEHSMEEALRKKFFKAGVPFLIAAPLMEGGWMEGLLVCGRKGGEEFQPEDRDFLRQLGEYVVLAFRQMRNVRNLEHAYLELKRNHAEVLQQGRLTSLGRIASGIVHGINNALSPIVGYTDMVLEEKASMDQRTRGYLLNIRTAAEDISSIIGRMREFYRNRQEQEVHPVDLNRLVEQAVEMTRPRWKTIQQRDGSVISVGLERLEHLPEVMGVEGEIREALINLLNNAIDALVGSGKVTIRTWADKTTVAVEVIDTGTGMEEHIRELCLEPFFTTKGAGGTGMGLAIVYGMVKRHAGEIEIESAPRQGTTVRLKFMREEIPAHDGSRSEKMHVLPSLRILCIDDDPSVRGLIADMLDADRHVVVVAEGGQRGLDLFRESHDHGEPFDVVITDLGMPYLGGREVTRMIKESSPLTPVVLMTGWLDEDASGGDLARRVDFVLRKPPTMRTIREALRAVRPLDRASDHGIDLV